MRRKIISGLLMGLAFFGLRQSSSAQCTQVSPYLETFASYTPSCWTEAQGRLSSLTSLTGTSSAWTSDGFLNAGTSGSARVNIFGTSVDEWVVSPIIDLGSGASSYQLEFDAGLTDYSGSGTDLMGADDSLAVVISLDSGDTWSNANILKLFTSGNQPSNNGESVVIDLTGYTGKVKIGFYAASSISNTDYNVYIDNFAINPLATCPKPNAFIASAITSNSTSLNWNENGSATSWQIQYGVTGFTLGTGTLNVVTSDSVNISSLTSNTIYQAYVRAICSSSDSSVWVGPISFTTLCAPFTAAYFDDFESAATSSTPDCWTEYKTYSSSYAEVRASSPFSGSNAINMYSSGASTTGNDSLILATPQFSDLVLGDKQISFQVSSSSTQNALIIGTVAATDPSSIFNPIDTITFSSTNSYSEVIIPFTTANGYNGTDQFIVFASNLGSTYTYIRIDDFNYTIIPSCPKPSGLMTSAVTNSSVSFNWTERGSATSWQIQYDTVNFPIGTGTKSVVASDSVHVTGLIAQTDYDVYVRAICGSSDTSVWLGPISFTTLCAPFTAPYFDDFESAATSSTPDCWTEYKTYSSSYAEVRASSPFSGSNAINMYSSGASTTGNDSLILATPQFSDLVLGDKQISFQVSSSSTQNALIIGTVAATDPSSIFNPIDTITFSSTNSYSEVIIPFTTANGYNGTDQFIVFASNLGSTYTYIRIDDFNYTIIPSCPKPSGLMTSAVTNSSVSFNWTERGSATSWQIQYDTVNFPIGTGTKSVVASDSVHVTGLIAQTDYDVYVRAICGSSDTSVWLGPISFTTLCNAVSTFPFFEDFESTNTASLPNCWSSQVISSTQDWAVRSGSTGDISGPYAGTKFMEKNYSSSESILFSPALDLSAIGSASRLNVWLHRHASAHANDEYIILINNAKTLVGADTLLRLYSKTTIAPTEPSTGWYNYNISIPVSYSNSTGAYIMFLGKTSAGFSSYDLGIDDYTIEALPACVAPSALTTANLTQTSIDLSWTENNSATEWEISYDITGFTAGQGIQSIVTNNPTSISSLSPNTTYDYYVRSICSPGDTSAWSAKGSFYTGYCTVSTTYSGDYISSLTSNGGNTNVSYTASSNPAGSYSDETAQTLTSYATGTFDITTTYVGGSNGVKVWVDWNNDLVFDDATELVGAQASSAASKTIIGSVPASANVGNYRMRVRAQYGSSANPPPCGNVSYGTTLDFTLTLVTPPSCLSVSNFSSAEITSSSTDLFWIENNSATSWQLEYDIAGYTQGSGIKSVVMSDSITLGSLLSNTSYDAYVRSICSSSDTSSWVGPITFTTLCAPFSAPFVEDFSTFVPSCWFEAADGTPNSGVTNLNSGDWRSTNYLNTTGIGKGAALNLYSNVDKEWIISPVLDLSVGAPLELVIGAGVTDFVSSSPATMGSDDEVLVLISEDNMTTWDTLYTWNLANQPTNTGSDYRISLSGYSASNSIVAIWATDGSVDDLEDYDFHIGRFELRTVPSCLEPTSLATANATGSTVDLSWIENNSATEWQITYDTVNFSPSTGNKIVVTSNPYTLTGLSNGTNLEWYVRSICAVGDTSTWSNVSSLATICPSPSTAAVLPFVEDWENYSGTNKDSSIVHCDASYKWYFNTSDPNGRVRYGADSETGSTAPGAVTLDRDPSGSVVINHLDLTLNLSNYTTDNIQMFFDYKEHGEENHPNDSVWIRGSDADTWIGVYDLFANKSTTFKTVGPINIDSILASKGQTVSATFQVRFGQEDDYPVSSDGFTFDDIIVELAPTPPLPYYPIGTINTEDATTGVADSLGVFCWTSGTVAGIDLDGNAGLSFTIIDQSGTNPEGINIYNFADVSNYVVNEGDSIMIRGEVQQFNGLTELFPDSIAIIKTGASLPNAVLVTTLDESTESALIRIEDLTVTAVPTGTSINISLTDGTNNFIMRVDADTDILDSLTFVVGDKLCSVNGIGGQFDSSNPYLDGYQIFPMSYADVVFAPTVDLGPDTIVCDTNNFMLDAGNFASYVWSTGALTRTITPTTANSVYSVIVTDANGCTGTDTVNVTVSVCVGINEIKQNNASIKFYPNPNNGQFKLQIDNVNAPSSKLEVMNIKGQIVYNENLIINGSISKDININVEKGVYFVRLINKNGVKVEKLIIE